MKTKRAGKILSLLLSACLVLGMMATTAFAFDSSTGFEEGDSIGLFVDGAYSQYTVETTQLDWDDYAGSDPHTFSAMYPPVLTIPNPEAYQFNVTDVFMPDLLLAAPVTENKGDSVELSFTHAMSLLLIGLTKDEGVSGDLLDAEFSLSNLDTGAKINLITGTVTDSYDAGGSYGTFELGENIFVAPQSLTPGDEFITVALNGENYPVKVPSDLTELESGKVTELTIDLTISGATCAVSAVRPIGGIAVLGTFPLSLDFQGGGSGGTPGDTITITQQPTASMSTPFEQSPGSISVTATASNDAPISYEWIQKFSDGTTMNVGNASTYEIPSDLIPGTYEFYCVLTAKDCDEVTSAKTTVTVSKASYTGSTEDTVFVKAGQATTDYVYTLPVLPEFSAYMTYTVHESGSSLINGTPVVEEETESPSGWKLTFNTSAQPDGTEGEITLTINEGILYKGSTFTLTVKAVDKQPVSITGLTGTDNAYSGAPQTGYTGTPNTGGYTGELEALYAGRNDTAYDSATPPTDAGEYTVTLSVPSAADYAGSLIIDFSILKKEVTVQPTHHFILQGDELPTPNMINYLGFYLTQGHNSDNSISKWAVAKLNVADSNTPGESDITFEAYAELTSERAKNYTLTHENGTLTIRAGSTVYTVTFNLNGGTRTGGGELTQSVSSGGSAIAPTVSRSGYTFTGWDKAFTNVTSTLMVTANWSYNGGGSDSTDSKPATPPTSANVGADGSVSQTQIAQEAASALAAATGNTATVRIQNAQSITPTALKALADAAAKASKKVVLHADTMQGSAVQGRLYIQPEALLNAKGPIHLGIYTEPAKTAATTALFGEYFDNTIATVSFEQQGGFGARLEVAAKVDLTGMDVTKLYFYSYNEATNTYKRIVKPAYWVDTNGYLHFYTALAGDIIISNGPLALNGGSAK